MTALEPYEPFLNDARAHAAESGLSDRFEFVQAAGKDFRIEPDRYDAAMCLGATWAWDGLDGTIAALAAGVRENGHVAAGEPYRHHPDDTAPQAPHDLTLAEILERFEARGVAVTTLIRSSVDDWDDYQSVRVKNLLDWVRDNPDHDDADDVRRWRREHAIDLAGRHMGWAIVAGRKTRHA